MKTLPRISEAEWQVMQVVWARHPVTTAEVVEALAETNAWKPETIRTLLNRLVKKKALTFQREGRMYRYAPLVQESDCVRAEGKTFLEKCYRGALSPMLAAFIGEHRMSDEEIEELKALLDAKRKGDES